MINPPAVFNGIPIGQAMHCGMAGIAKKKSDRELMGISSPKARTGRPTLNCTNGREVSAMELRCREAFCAGKYPSTPMTTIPILFHKSTNSLRAKYNNIKCLVFYYLFTPISKSISRTLGAWRWFSCLKA